MDWKISHKLRPLWMPNSRVFEALDDYNNQWFRELMVPARHEYVPFIDMRCNLWSGWEKGIVHPNKTRCVQDLWANEPPQKNNPHYEQDDFLFRYGFWSMFNFSDKVHERKWNMQRKANILPTETTNFEINPQRRLLEGVYKNQSGLNEAHTKQSKTTDLIETHRQLQSIGSKESEPIAGKTTIQPYIAVHIRTGIGSTWNDPMRHGSNEDLAKFYQCAKRLQKGIQDRQRQVLSQCKQGKNKDEPPPMPIYVAADNVMAKKIMKEMDSAEPKQTVRAIEDMQIYHIDRSVKRGDVIDNELTVWAELNILLEATCIVGSRSGFSDLARWLQPFQNKRCAIQFYQCHDDAEVERALNNVEFVCPKE